MEGKIHSFESFATLDGGGIRFAIFMQGCPLRCVYCHNADTQSFESTKTMTAKQIVLMIDKLKHYYLNGGVTISGGEPLAQAEFLSELLKEIKLMGLHAAVDTSLALIPKNFDEIIDLTDLFIVDLKFWDEESYEKYCGGKLATVLDGIKKIEQSNKKILLRTVIVPNINDTKEHIFKYFKLVNGCKCVDNYELLAYHTLGSYKFAELGRVNALDGTMPLGTEKLVELQNFLNNLRAQTNEEK